jgi:hypothetical protein
LSHALLASPTFHQVLLDIDRELAAEMRTAGCQACGGRLDSRTYPRKPRGGPPGLSEEHDRRLSFCCAVEGCRKSHTPPSVRFLGRRVWLGAVVVLAAALQHGPSPRRVSRLREWLEVSERTLRRWRSWWLERFASCPFWRGCSGLFATPVDTSRLPASLLERFAGEAVERLVSTLSFLQPISVGSARHELAG